MSAPAASTAPAPQTGGAPNLAQLKRWLWTAGGLLIIVGVLLLAGWLFHPWTLFTPSRTTSVQESVIQQPLTQCDYAHRRLDLTSAPTVFNPGARCAYRFTVAEGTIEFDGPDGKMTVEANHPVSVQMWTETARAVNGHAVLLYQLYPAQG